MDSDLKPVLERIANALERLKVFEGIPAPFSTMKRMVVPAALRVLRLRPGRSFCVIGRLSSEVGWKYEKVLAKLEAERKEADKTYYAGKEQKAEAMRRTLFSKAKELEPVNKTLAAFGY